ncbi:hypothetical protein TNCV_3543371 [Trichonephila clavipes]|nr:hypothetical protein TNCV_3543371 [Trichonephila clavipes]
MLFPAVFSKKLGILDDMSTGYMRLMTVVYVDLDLPPDTITTPSVKRRWPRQPSHIGTGPVACLVTSSSSVPIKDPPCRAAMPVKSVES